MPAHGYQLILPPEWVRVPMRVGTEEAIKSIVDEAFATLPRSAPLDKIGPYRREMERRLCDVVKEARRAEALDLYLPVEPMHGIAIPASIVVSEMRFPDEVAVEPSAVVNRLVTASGRGGESSIVQVDGVHGVRTDRTILSGTEDAGELGSRRVDYVAPVPGDPGRWIAVAFSTLGAGDPEDDIADLSVALYDAMMSTFRWR
ncbi:hypothetical protein [Streptomyces sp. WMMC905]|uniref:hypothetical protein n=1 Tax=Streptomyces sp. WMMC905 TaxID=3404123 RepID=UPI003B93C535